MYKSILNEPRGRRWRIIDRMGNGPPAVSEHRADGRRCGGSGSSNEEDDADVDWRASRLTSARVDRIAFALS